MKIVVKIKEKTLNQRYVSKLLTGSGRTQGFEAQTHTHIYSHFANGTHTGSPGVI